MKYIFYCLSVGLFLLFSACQREAKIAPVSLVNTSSSAARAAASGLAIECDVNQGYRFNKNQYSTFGYITALTISENLVWADIHTTATGIFTKPVVSVLTSANWSLLPSDNIVFKGRISRANAQLIRMLTMQSTRRVTVALSFVIYRFDTVNKVYFTQFKSYKGTAPLGVRNAETSDQIYARVSGSNGTEFGLKVGAQAEKDPTGIQNYTLELTLAPTVAPSPQQILLQTSPTVKQILPWGLPQS